MKGGGREGGGRRVEVCNKQAKLFFVCPQHAFNLGDTLRPCCWGRLRLQAMFCLT